MMQQMLAADSRDLLLQLQNGVRDAAGDSAPATVPAPRGPGSSAALLKEWLASHLEFD